MKYCVYIIQSITTGKIYIGQTNNIKKELKDTTKRYRVKHLPLQVKTKVHGKLSTKKITQLVKKQKEGKYN